MPNDPLKNRIVSTPERLSDIEEAGYKETTRKLEELREQVKSPDPLIEEYVEKVITFIEVDGVGIVVKETGGKLLLCVSGSKEYYTDLTSTLKEYGDKRVEKTIDGMVEMVDGMKKEEIIIEGCENCGQEGYCRAWYGKGAENDPHGYGDRYYPTGSVVFCKECSNDFGLGKCWLGEEIWKKSSDLPEYDDQRLNHIKKKVKENVGYNQALSDLKSLLLAQREVIEKGE